MSPWSRSWRGVGPVLLAVIVIVLVTAFPARAEAPPQPSFFGVYSEDPLGPLPDEQNAILSAQREAGVGLIRVPFHWPSIEPARGEFQWGPYDWLVDASAKAGIALLPTLQYSPSWATSEPRGSTARGAFPPRNPADYGRFAEAVVRRYGENGTFWQEHRWTPYRPIRAWQVWNEPNIPYFWPSGPNPTAYTNLLVTAYRYVKAADPSAQVVTAGITNSVMGISQTSFINGMYRAGAKGHFDALAVHPYAPDARTSVGLLESARQLMDSNEDASPLWATELGWASGGEGGRLTSDEAGQAARLGAFLRAATAERSALRLGVIIYYNWKDRDSTLPGPAPWPARSGLLRLDDTRKPAYFAFRDTVRDLLTPKVSPGEEGAVSPETTGSSIPQAVPDSSTPPMASAETATPPVQQLASDPRSRLRLSQRGRLRVGSDGAVPVTVSCSIRRCTGLMRLRRDASGRRPLVAQLAFSLRSGTRETLRLPLNATGWRLFGKLSSIVVRPATHGVSLTQVRRLRILPPRGWQTSQPALTRGDQHRLRPIGGPDAAVYPMQMVPDRAVGQP